jgi:hypothetical protein
MHSSEIQDIFLPASRVFWGFLSPFANAGCGQAQKKGFGVG